MRKWGIIPLLVLLVGILGGGTLPPSTFGISADEIRVRAAVMDYVEGIYERDAERLAQALHPEAKRHAQATRDGEGAGNTLDRDDLIGLAAARICDARLPRKGPKRVLIYELRDNVAAVKLTAAWGVDLLHLAKEEGRWRIIGIVGTAPRSLLPETDVV